MFVEPLDRPVDEWLSEVVPRLRRHVADKHKGVLPERLPQEGGGIQPVMGGEDVLRLSPRLNLA